MKISEAEKFKRIFVFALHIPNKLKFDLTTFTSSNSMNPFYYNLRSAGIFQEGLPIKNCTITKQGIDMLCEMYEKLSDSNKKYTEIMLPFIHSVVEVCLVSVKKFLDAELIDADIKESKFIKDLTIAFEKMSSNDKGKYSEEDYRSSHIVYNGEGNLPALTAEEFRGANKPEHNKKRMGYHSTHAWNANPGIGIDLSSGNDISDGSGTQPIHSNFKSLFDCSMIFDDAMAIQRIEQVISNIKDTDSDEIKQAGMNMAVAIFKQYLKIER